jgi:hypothetical protein
MLWHDDGCWRQIGFKFQSWRQHITIRVNIFLLLTCQRRTQCGTSEHVMHHDSHVADTVYPSKVWTAKCGNHTPWGVRCCQFGARDLCCWQQCMLQHACAHSSQRQRFFIIQIARKQDASSCRVVSMAARPSCIVCTLSMYSCTLVQLASWLPCCCGFVGTQCSTGQTRRQPLRHTCM